MQYEQRKLQRSINEMRKYVWSLPWESCNMFGLFFISYFSLVIEFLDLLDF